MLRTRRRLSEVTHLKYLLKEDSSCGAEKLIRTLHRVPGLHGKSAFQGLCEEEGTPKFSRAGSWKSYTQSKREEERDQPAQQEMKLDL